MSISCIDYLILPSGNGWGDVDLRPPGDNYVFWGWQNDSDHENDEDCGQHCVDGISKRTEKRFMEFATGQNIGSLRIGDWELRSWEKE